MDIFGFMPNDNRDSVIDHYLLPAFREAYKKNVLLKNLLTI